MTSSLLQRLCCGPCGVVFTDLNNNDNIIGRPRLPNFNCTRTIRGLLIPPPCCSLISSSFSNNDAAAVAPLINICSKKATTGRSSTSRLNSRISAAAPISSPIINDGDDGYDFSSLFVYDEDEHSPSTLPSPITSPWLTLPPAFENGNMVYKFYSIKDDKVISINKRSDKNKLIKNDHEEEEPADDSVLVGSSHGWLVLLNPRNCDLFLSNPLTGRHIKLPPIHHLAFSFEVDTVNNRRKWVKSVILTSSPDDDQDCVAVMTYSHSRSLAYCRPARLGGSTNHQWTKYHIQQESCVYSSRLQLFFSLRILSGGLVVFDFDATDPWSFILGEHRRPRPSYEDEDSFMPESWKSRYKLPFLVVDETPNSSSTVHILLVNRYIMTEMYPDGSSASIRHNYGKLMRHPDGSSAIINENCNKYADNYDADGKRYPYKTIGFTVHKYDPKSNEFIYMDSLDGLAIFIGVNHSFVMIATHDLLKPKPNCIYFTDTDHLVEFDKPDVCKYGWHDNGIYDYKDKTFSPCYYPCDYQSIRRFEHAPMWFTPSKP